MVGNSNNSVPKSDKRVTMTFANYTITIGCIYNSVHEYLEMIRSIVRTEKELKFSQIEFLGIYNSQNSKFKSARKAIEWIIKKSHSRYIMVVHQDVEFISQNPLSSFFNYFDSLSNVGIIGTAGVNNENERCGIIVNGNAMWGDLFLVPKAVEGIDELLFAFDKEKFKEFHFIDSNEWHGYATEMCMHAKSIGLNNYVVPIVVHHKSVGRNRKGLSHIHKELEKRYPNVLPFHTTVGFLGKNESLSVKVIIKNYIQKKTLLPLLIYRKLGARIAAHLVKMFPLLQKNGKISKKSTMFLPFFIQKELLPILFVHLRKEVDKVTDFDPLFIKTASINNLVDKFETHHLYLPSDKIYCVPDLLKNYDQVVIENYLLVPENRLKNMFLTYKIKFKSKKMLLGVKYYDT